MTRTARAARSDAQEDTAAMAAVVDAAADAAADPRGVMMEIPLSKLKASPRNARKTPHSLEAIQALAGSIAAKTLLHAPVVEPEIGEGGTATGSYLVTIGEGRRLALRLLAERKMIAKAEPIRCLVLTAFDPFEISLDENVTRTDMHPADQFEAFSQVAEERGWGAEEIAARFGVSAHVVRQRMRLGAVSPKLMALYREEQLTLDQLMAFAVSEDHARQEQVLDGLTWNKSASVIRRAMTELKVAANDKRAIFIGAEAYAAAGGTILRDLFTEDDGGWFEDVALLDRLTGEKLEALAEGLRAEGWKWVETHLEFPHSHGLPRLYPRPVQRSEEDQATLNALASEYDTLTEQWAEVEDLPPEVEARLQEIDAALEAWGDGTAFDPEDIARAGVFVVLGYDGLARIEKGFLRPGDARAFSQDEAEDSDREGRKDEADDRTDGRDGEGTQTTPPNEAEDDEPDGLTPLSDRLVADLTAHRTAALRDALAGDPDTALLALVHVLALRTFYPMSGNASCLDVRLASAPLGVHAEGIDDGPVSRRIAERHAAWARQLPQEAGDLWAFMVALDGDSRLSLMAHCASLTLSAVHNWERRPLAWAQADALAAMVGLDMTACWTPTVRGYLGRVTKARILEAVAEGASAEAAERLAGLKKAEMAQAAEEALAGKGWLPPLLRTARAYAAEDEVTEGEATGREAATPALAAE